MKVEPAKKNYKLTSTHNTIGFDLALRSGFWRRLTWDEERAESA
jgi:hypothetical protein